jgi:outer membrane murein-binding lipoprotein Lpp
MQSKPVAAIVVLTLIVASLLMTGCTSPTNQTANTAATDLKFISSYVPANFGYTITAPFAEIKNARSNTAYTGTVQNINGTMMTMIFEKVSSEKDAKAVVTQNIQDAVTKGLSPIPPTGNAKDTMEFKTYNNTWTGAKFNAGFVSADFFDVGYKQVSPLGWYVLSISGTSVAK